MEVVVKLSEATFRPLFVRVYDWAAVELVEESTRTSQNPIPSIEHSLSFPPCLIPCLSYIFVWLVSASTAGHLIARRTTLFAVMEGLLERFKSIMTPYTAIVLDHAQELLQAYVEGTLTDLGLWGQILVSLAKSFEYDEGGECPRFFFFFFGLPMWDGFFLTLFWEFGPMRTVKKNILLT